MTVFGRIAFRVLCAAMVASAAAQGGADAQSAGPAGALPFAIGGACPRNVGAAAGAQSDEELRTKFETGGTRQIILPRIQTFSDVAQRNRLDGLDLEFQTPVRVLHWNAGPLRGHFVKFTTLQGERCGWIAEGALLPKERGRPLTVGDLKRQGLAEFAEQDPSSTLDAKVLVRNYFKRNEAAAAKGAKVYFRVGDTQPRDTLKIFSVLKVFDVQKAPDGNWFFVGGERATSTGVEAVLQGWVKAEDLIPWSTRVNVFYQPGRTNLPIFETNQAATAAGQPLATQDPKDTEPTKQNIPRFPLLDTTYPRTGLALHKIAFPGAACDRGGENCVTARTNAEIEARLGGDLWRSQHIDFLFVIDNTESMKDYFDPVVQAIQEFLAEIGADDAQRIRFSAVVYGDFSSSSAASADFQYRQVIPFGSPDNRRELGKLVGRPSFHDPIGDYPEAAFPALNRAIREAQWGKDAAWRMTVWIGDHPGRDASVHGKLAPVGSARDVGEAVLSVKGTWTALNVRGDYDRTHNDAFVRQAGEVLAAADNWGLPLRRTYDPQSGKETNEKIKDGVKASLFEILKSTKDVPLALARKSAAVRQSGRGTTPSQGAGEPVLPHALLAQRFVEERLSLTREEQRDFFSRNQLVTEGWVRQPKADPDFRYWLTIEPRKMDGMVNSAQSLCASLSDVAPNYDSVRDAMVETLKGVVGETPRVTGPEDETNIRKFLEKRLHVPVEHFSRLLDKDLDAFVAWYTSAQPAETSAFKEDVCKRAKLLELARDNVRLTGDAADLVFDPVARGWRPKPGSSREFAWGWGTEQGVYYFYIPLDYAL